MESKTKTLFFVAFVVALIAVIALLALGQYFEARMALLVLSLLAIPNAANLKWSL